MKFRKDINGLRAIAVIAVVLFHFDSSWVSGGFAGVDVFFVISGFLMTGIIFRGMVEVKKFSIFKFYIARANRIIPALSFLCLVLLLFGWFHLAPYDYKILGKHIGSSIGFVSNIIYWSESGYFSSASHGKWLLHTWSLSVEWQFYLLYPLILVAIRKFTSVDFMKLTVLIGTILGFIFCILVSYNWPDFAYYLLPVRAWEMMLGGVAFLYPFTLPNHMKKILESVGAILIVATYFLISKENVWPGGIALLPTLGTFLVIQSNNNSIITNNFIFQKLGAWSYSIYLWHWPIVVAIHQFSLNENFKYIGIILSVLLGFLSFHYIERISFKNNFVNIFDYLKCKPIYMALVIGLVASITFIKNGFIMFSSSEYQYLTNAAKESPFRDRCHLDKYQDPALSCEYFAGNVSWATLGDSHTVEIAYALAEKLKTSNVGLKHFSFSGCKPSYGEANNFSKCARWYNESIDYIINDKKIRDVVLNHRFTADLFGGDASKYPLESERSVLVTGDIIRIINHLDELIIKFSENKDNVYIFYPIPELPKDINKIVGDAYQKGISLVNLTGTSVNWYEQRNQVIIKHFNNAKYPKNVHLLNPKDIFCDNKNCFAVKNGIPLYFDNDHPSLIGATKLVEMIIK